MQLLVALAVWPLVATAVELKVEGAVTCPTPAEVEARLRPLLAREGLPPGDRIRLDREDGVLRVALIRADGRVRGIRNVDERHDCGELAEAAAVILASWQMQPEGVVAAPPTAGPASAVVARSAPAVLGNRRAARGTQVEAGVGVTGGFVPGQVVPGLSFDASLGAAAGGLAVKLGARFSGWQQQEVPATVEGGAGTASVKWRRLPVTLGPAWRWRGGSLAFTADAGVAAAWLSLAGSGFASNERHDTLDLGGVAGLRLGFPALLSFLSPAVHPFLGVSGAFWPRRTVAASQDGLGRAALPRGELGATLGIAFGR